MAGAAGALQAPAAAAGVALQVGPDRHFMCSRSEFAAHAAGRSELLLENFYRAMRLRHGVLMDAGGRPAGGRWNYDAGNRRSFGVQGPGFLPAPLRFEPDVLTREVLALVNDRFAGHRPADHRLA